MAQAGKYCAHNQKHTTMQVLNGVNLASFSLVDCAQTLLGQRLEVVPYTYLAKWAGLQSTKQDMQYVFHYPQ